MCHFVSYAKTKHKKIRVLFVIHRCLNTVHKQTCYIEIEWRISFSVYAYRHSFQNSIVGSTLCINSNVVFVLKRQITVRSVHSFSNTIASLK